MDDAGAVRLGKRIGDLQGDRHGLVERQGSYRGLTSGTRSQSCLERLPIEVFEHEEIRRALAADVVQGADVRVVQGGHDPRLALEPVAELRIARERVGEDLDRDRAIEPRVARLVHLAHAAGTQGGEDLIGAEVGAGSEGHVEWIIRAARPRRRDYASSTPQWRVEDPAERVSTNAAANSLHSCSWKCWFSGGVVSR